MPFMENIAHKLDALKQCFVHPTYCRHCSQVGQLSYVGFTHDYLHSTAVVFTETSDCVTNIALKCTNITLESLNS